MSSLPKETIEIEGKKYQLNQEAECLHDPSGKLLRE